jgi:hypothetical protein
MNELAELIGQKLVSTGSADVDFVSLSVSYSKKQQSLRLQFDGCTADVFNPAILRSSRIEEEATVATVRRLLGAKVVAVSSTDQELQVDFSGTWFVVSLRDEDYQGPEAAAFYMNGRTVVL